MFCFRCGKKLPPRGVSCPDCNTPQKRRKRYRNRMILGLFIFLAGALVGSIFDSLIFKGRVLEHTFFNVFNESSNTTASETPVMEEVGPEMPDESTPQIANPSQLAMQQNNDSSNQESSEELTKIEASTANENIVASATEEQKNETETEIAASASSMVETETMQIGSDTEASIAVKEKGELVFDKGYTLEAAEGSNYHGFVSEDGKEVVFASNRYEVNGKKKYQCMVKSFNPAAKAEKLFDWPGNIWTPEFTPDRSKVIFSSDSTKFEHIFVYNRKTGKIEKITSGTTKNMMPSISPDGTLVAFVSNQKGANNIWISGLDGKNLIQISSGKYDDREPRWWPDGRSIVFTRIYEHLKKSSIVRVELEPLGSPVELIKSDSRNWLADVSPDGSKMAFIRSESSDGSKNTIFIYDVKSSKSIAIKPIGPAEYFRPIWLKHQDGLIFHANKNKKKSLYIADFKRKPKG